MIRLMKDAGCVTWSALLIGIAALACGPSDSHENDSVDVDSGTFAEGTKEDWRIVRQTLADAWADGLHQRPIGETMVKIGSTFVGTTYTPRTLEIEGPERLVINLRELDCVTFVENVLALSRFVHSRDPSVLEDDASIRSEYRSLLTEIRYRGGVIAGYPSRLHYFSEWISDNESRGLVRDVSRDLGAVADATPIVFMSTHTKAYRQLADPELVAEVAADEGRLSSRSRYFVPQDRIAEIAGAIDEGDIIAATSTVPGLDVAHTGIVMRRGGEAFLLHAPLVGSVVQISETPIAERIQGISGQDGIMVARPLTPGAAGASIQRTSPSSFEPTSPELPRPGFPALSEPEFPALSEPTSPELPGAL